MTTFRREGTQGVRVDRMRRSAWRFRAAMGLGAGVAVGLTLAGVAAAAGGVRSASALVRGVSGVRCVHRDPWVCYAPRTTARMRLALTGPGRAYLARHGLGLYTLGASVQATLLGTLSGVASLITQSGSDPAVEFRSPAPTTVLLPLGGTPTLPVVKLYLGVGSLPPWPRLPRRLALPKANLAPPDTGLLGTDRTQAYLTALERAQRLEGVPTFRLPRTFNRLTAPEQLFVLIDLMRVTRGLWPLAALTRPLDGLAAAGARAGTDPVDRGAATWSSNWYSGLRPLAAVYDWMYLDGPGPYGLNIDCQRGDLTGCWGHRKNILGDAGPFGTMGAGFSAPNGTGGGTAALFVRGLDPAPRGALYTWAEAVRAGARPAH